MRSLTALVICAALAPIPTLAQQTMTSKDIKYLATMAGTDPTYYRRNVMGVAQFSGTGRADSTVSRWGRPNITVDMGAFGQISCRGFTATQRLQPGDRVTISGSVGGASTAASVHKANGLAAELNPGTAMLKEKDTLNLITNSCQVTKK